MKSRLLFLWAIGGVLLLLSQAIFRLSQIAFQGLTSGQMSRSQWLICGAWIIANAYLEGYRGFQKRFVPRVLARAHYYSSEASMTSAGATVLVAPLFSMAYFKANRRALISAWAVTLLVMCAIVLIRWVPQPWRGIIDAGVVVGLGWGTVTLLVGTLSILRGHAPTGSPDLPDAPMALDPAVKSQ